MMDDINFGLMDWKKWIQDSLHNQNQCIHLTHFNETLERYFNSRGKGKFCREGYYFHLMYLKIASLTIRGGGGEKKSI